MAGKQNEPELNTYGLEVDKDLPNEPVELHNSFYDKINNSFENSIVSYRSSHLCLCCLCGAHWARCSVRGKGNAVGLTLWCYSHCQSPKGDGTRVSQSSLFQKSRTLVGFKSNPCTFLERYRIIPGFGIGSEHPKLCNSKYSRVSTKL